MKPKNSCLDRKLARLDTKICHVTCRRALLDSPKTPLHIPSTSRHIFGVPSRQGGFTVGPESMNPPSLPPEHWEIALFARLLSRVVWQRCLSRSARTGLTVWSHSAGQIITHQLRTKCCKTIRSTSFNLPRCSS